VDDLRKLALEAGRVARKRAPGGFEVLYTRTDSASRDNAGGRGSAHQATLAVRLYDGRGNLGLAEGAWSGPADTGRIVDLAASHTGPAPEGDDRPSAKVDIVERGLGIDDPRLPMLDEAARAEVIDTNLESLAGLDGVRVGRFLYTEERVQRAFASSRDIELSECSTRFSLAGAVSAAADPRLGCSDVLVSRNFAEVGSKPLGVDLGRRVLALTRRAALPPSPTPIVLEQRVVGALLPLLAVGFSLERMQAGDSYVANRIGRRIGSGPLHVIDDAMRPGGLASRRFDARGVGTLPVTLLKEGVVAGWYQGAAAAGKSDSRPSGHEGPGGALWIGNLICRAGTRSRNMLFPDMARFVVVDEVLGVEPVELKSGRLRARVRCSTWERNACVGSAGEQVLDTTADQLFMGVLHLCNDQERHGVVDTPTWIVDGPWFAG